MSPPSLLAIPVRRRSPPRPAAWPGRRSIAVAVGGLIVAATVWWFTARAPLEAAGQVAAPARIAASAPAHPTGPSRVAALPVPLPPVTPYPAHGTSGLATDDPLTAYRRANVYPPTSRPLTVDQLDLLHPDQRHETMRRDDHDAGIQYLFTADRYFVIGDETLTATLDVRRNGAPLPVMITQAFATVIDPGSGPGGTGARPPRTVPLEFSPSGAVQIAQLAPASLGLTRQTAITLFLEFDHGAGRQQSHIDFQYTPTGGIPARFTGEFRDEVDAGSLVIHAGVEVSTPGHYVIDCNLFDAADQPVAWTRYKGDLIAGVHPADLLFFGKVLVDGQARGPFHIGQLRGARFAPGLDPDLEQMPPFTGTYTTRSYPTDAFSSAEYDSAEKQKMLELLGQQRNHLGAAGKSSGDGTTGTGDPATPPGGDH